MRSRRGGGGRGPADHAGSPDRDPARLPIATIPPPQFRRPAAGPRGRKSQGEGRPRVAPRPPSRTGGGVSDRSTQRHFETSSRERHVRVRVPHAQTTRQLHRGSPRPRVCSESPPRVFRHDPPPRRRCRRPQPGSTPRANSLGSPSSTRHANQRTLAHRVRRTVGGVSGSRRRSALPDRPGVTSPR
jgi:hypothetical protein